MDDIIKIIAGLFAIGVLIVLIFYLGNIAKDWFEGDQQQESAGKWLLKVFLYGGVVVFILVHWLGSCH